MSPVRIERDWPRLTGQWDVVVVGGGISGVCIAREAAGRGLRTLLLEKDDFGAGTSSATTKYIHGGIRYLEQYQFGVVRESLRERRDPGPRRPAPRRPDAVRHAGLEVVEAGRRAHRGGRRALRRAVLRPQPRRAARAPHPAPPVDEPVTAPGRGAVVVPDQLLGAWAYHDTMNIHPERLLLAFLQTGMREGLVAMNHAPVTGFLTEPAAAGANGGVTVTGVRVVDRLTGTEHEIRSRVVVNAGGPWLDLVLQLLARPPKVRLSRSKGVHVLTRSLGGIPDAVFARARNGRHVIVSPWQGRSWIGPTDTPIDDLPDDVAVDDTDVRLILDTVNDTINPAVMAPLTEDDVEATAVGIRPLVAEEGQDTYKASRRHDIYDHGVEGAANLWSISGGSGRRAGRWARRWSTRCSGVRPPSRESLRAHMTAGAWPCSPGSAGPRTPSRSWRRRPPPVRCSRSTAPLECTWPASTATEHERVLDLVEQDPSLARRVSDRPDRLDVLAQAVHAVTHEGACTLDDIVRRRLVVGTLGPCTREELVGIAAVVGPLLGWSEADVGRQVAAAAHPAPSASPAPHR